MSHFEEMNCDPQVKNLSKKKKSNMSLLDFVGDTKREESLIGLQYVVEIKMLDSDKTVVKCNLCNVKGQLATMKEHLVGSNHIKLYMEKHYYSVLNSLRKTAHHKGYFSKLLKKYAKEIERAEGTQTIQIEYVSAGDMKKEQENWITEQEERLEFHAEQNKSQVLDRRQLALSYSERFKISSREEAAIVLNLTQQLSDQLEQYFLKYKGLGVLDSTVSNSFSTKSTPAPTNFPPYAHENPYPKSDGNQGLSVAKKMAWHTEEPSSSSVCPPASVHLFDTVSVKREDNWGMKRKLEVSKGDDECGELQQSGSTSEFQSRTKRPYKEHDDFSTKHSSSSYVNDLGCTQHSLTKVSSLHSSSTPIAPTYTHTHISTSKEKSYGGELQMVKDTQKSVFQNSLNDNTATIQEIKHLNDPVTAKTSGLDAEKNTAVPEPSSSTNSYSYKPDSERPSSSHTQGKTSKTLSPDILQLLKGKDANTVTNILRTLSPFYPALQDVNLEILAQVLVNTGALD